ncbi:MAG: protein kinase [Kofleriaceae bacterium]
MACLDDNQVLAFVERTLDEPTWRSLAEHVDQCETCLQLTCAVAATLGDLAGASGSWKRGDQVGRYELVEMIGRGGMGGVYVANDPQLDRKVALKIVRTARFAEPEIRTRLEREAKAMAQITHPNVVAVYDSGALDDGVFIAMELLSGEQLAAWTKQPGRTWQEITRAYIAAGHGLAAAHAAGIVHRDMKPQNVMVTDKGRVVVADFGLAVVGSESGEFVGTPRYMSYEHLTGGEVTAKSDQFGFAVALYEALNGKPPFAGGTMPELREAVRTTLPAKPRNAAVPLAIHGALVRALASDPAKRWPTIDALVQELEHALRPSPLKYYALFAVVVAALVVGAAAIVHARREKIVHVPVPVTMHERAQIAVKPFENSTGDPALDDTLDLILSTQLARAHEADVIASYELEQALEQVHGNILTLDPKLIVSRGTVAKDGDAYTITFDLDLPGHPIHARREHLAREGLGAAMVEIANDARAALGDSDRAGAPMAKSVDAVHTYVACVHAAIAGDLQKGADLCRSAINADPEFVHAYVALGTILYNAGERGAAGPAMERAVALKDRLGERERYDMLGSYYGAIGRYSEAIAAYQQLLARFPGDNKTQVAITATALDAGSFPLALELARNAAKDHPTVPVARGNLIIAELAANRITEAAQDGDQMIADLPKPPDFAACAVMAAHALAGDSAKAHQVLDFVTKQNPDLAVTAQADLAMYEKRAADAKPALEAFLAKNPPDETRGTRLRLALVDRVIGDRDGAIAAAKIARTDVTRIAYFAMQILVEADAAPDAGELAAKWAADDTGETRAFGHILAGDIALHRGDLATAQREYTEADHHGATWVVHERRRALAQAKNDRESSDRETGWLEAHRGEIAVFLTPSAGLLKPR